MAGLRLGLAKSGAAALLIIFLGGPAGAQAPAGQSGADRANRGLVEVIAGSADGTALRLAADLADALDDGATRRILPVVGKGSVQNLFDLKALRGIDLALVQADVLDYVKVQRLYPGIESRLTYIAKLYNEEFHLLASGNVKSINDLAGRKVNLGIPGDGTAITGGAIFGRLKIKVETTSYDPMLALEKLRSGEIAAMAYVTGKPAPLFTALRRKDDFHFIAVPMTNDLVSTYLPAQLTAEDYPELVAGQGPVDTVAVAGVMVAANFVPESERYRNIANFVDAFFTQFPKLLEAPRHPKWQEVNLTAELPGWRRFAPADAWLKRNAGAPVATNEHQMREIFSKFLDERSRISGRAMNPQQKGELFDEFKRWQNTQTQ